MKLSWHRKQLTHPHLLRRVSDWVLVDENNEIHAHLWDTEISDLIGSWRWRVFIDHKMTEGSSHSGKEARESCEELLLKSRVIEPGYDWSAQGFCSK